jgi:hypothetical protein
VTGAGPGNSGTFGDSQITRNETGPPQFRPAAGTCEALLSTGGDGS